jgi:hypothetical protein
MLKEKEEKLMAQKLQLKASYEGKGLFPEDLVLPPKVTHS